MRMVEASGTLVHTAAQAESRLAGHKRSPLTGALLYRQRSSAAPISHVLYHRRTQPDDEEREICARYRVGSVLAV
jgi:hypothetical protein